MGNSAGLGKPPAKEMMPGFSVIFRISRMAEAETPLARAERLFIMMGHPHVFMCLRVRTLVWCISCAFIQINR
jgi:hypothetical protein